MRVFVVPAALAHDTQRENIEADVLDEHGEVVLPCGRDNLLREQLVPSIILDLGDEISFDAVFLVEVLVVLVDGYDNSLAEDCTLV